MRELGVCPVCNGSKVMPCPDNMREHGIKYGWFGYDKERDTVPCNNCGGQTMTSTPTGMVYLRYKDSKPCTHDVNGKKVGNCLYEYSCKYCGFTYQIDSGD